MPQKILATISQAASVGLLLLAAFLSWRISEGAWTKPLPGSLAYGFVLLAAGCLCPGSLREWLKGCGPNERGWRGICTAAVWWSAALVIGFQILSGTATAWLLWLPLLAAEIWSRYDVLERSASLPTDPLPTVLASPPSTMEEPQPPTNPVDTQLAIPQESAQDCDNNSEIENILNNNNLTELTESIDSSIMQQWTRQQSDGEESLRGLVRVLFTSNQSTAVVHVSFCPAFAETPEVEAAVIEGIEAEVVPTQVFPYGARLEVRRDPKQRTDPAEAVIEVLAASSTLE